MSVTSFPSASFADLPGKRQIWNLPNPGAGNEWSFAFPGGYYYRMLGGSVTFTCSAAVAARSPGIQLTDGTNILGGAWATTTFAANSAVAVMYSPSAVWSSVGVVNAWLVLDVSQVWIPPTYVLQSNTRLLQAGDAYTNIVLWFEQLEIGARGIPMGRHEPTLAEEEELYGVG